MRSKIVDCEAEDHPTDQIDLKLVSSDQVGNRAALLVAGGGTSPLRPSLDLVKYKKWCPQDNVLSLHKSNVRGQVP